MCWPWQTNVRVACGGTTQLCGHTFCPRAAPAVFVPVLFSLGFHLPTCCETSIFFSQIHNEHLHFHSPCPSITPLRYEKGLPVLDARTLTQIFQVKHTLCPLAQSIQVWLPVLIASLQRQVRQQVYQSSGTLTHLSLTDRSSSGPTWPANLSCFVGDGGNT